MEENAVHFILGGRSQGKKEYALSLKDDNSFKVLDLAEEDNSIYDCNDFDIIINLHEWVKHTLKRKEEPLRIIKDMVLLFNEKIITGDEIGCGIVPIDSFERLWRDETGRVYQFICKNADIVDRVFAGIPVRIKGK